MFEFTTKDSCFDSSENIINRIDDPILFDNIPSSFSLSIMSICNNDDNSIISDIVISKSNLGGNNTGLKEDEEKGEKVAVQKIEPKESMGTKKGIKKQTKKNTKKDTKNVTKKDTKFFSSFLYEYGDTHINFLRGIRLDDLAKKIKTYAANRIISSVEKTINEIIGENNENLSFKYFILKKLRAEVYTNFEKNYNIKLLNGSIKSFLSQKNESNEKIINELLKKYENNPIINYIFNLTVENFINILFRNNTYNLNLFVKNIGSFDDISEEEKQKMKKNEKKVVSEEEENAYFNLLQYLAIHLKEYYDEKIGRIRKKKEKNISLNSF